MSAAQLTNNGTLAGNDSLSLTTRNLYNGAHGQLATGGGLTLDLSRLENQGQLSVNDGLTLRGNTLINGGDINAAAQTLTNDASGTWLSGGALRLNGNQLTNAGQLQGDTLALKAGSLDNRGVMNGIQGLTGTVQGALTNKYPPA